MTVKFEGDPNNSESQLAITIDDEVVRVFCEPNNRPLIVADEYFILEHHTDCSIALRVTQLLFHQTHCEHSEKVNLQPNQVSRLPSISMFRAGMERAYGIS